MKKQREYLIVFLFGAFLYGLIEVMWRGHTHWTMAVTGGLALISLYYINSKYKNKSIFFRCLLGAVIITILEFTVGIIVNIMLKWNVWDYSGRPFNILGQICPMFIGFWYLLCIPGMMLCKGIKKSLKI